MLKEWEQLCVSFSLSKSKNLDKQSSSPFEDDGDAEDDNEEDAEDEVFEVERILAICFGDLKEKGERGLYFLVYVLYNYA